MASEDFKNNVREWVTIDTQIKEAARAIKDLKRRSNDLKVWIMDQMEQNEIGVCHIHGGAQILRIIHRETKVKPRKDEVIAKIGDFLSSRGVEEITGGDLYHFVYEEGLDKRQARSLSRRSTKPSKKRRLDEEEPAPEEDDDEDEMATV